MVLFTIPFILWEQFSILFFFLRRRERKVRIQSDLNKKGCQKSQVYKVDLGVKSALKGVHTSSLLHPSLHFHQNLDFRRIEMQILHLPLAKHKIAGTPLTSVIFISVLNKAGKSSQPPALLQPSNVVCQGH